VIGALTVVAPDVDPGGDRSDRDLAEQLDIDSMAFLNIVVAIHEKTGIEIPERDYPELSTLSDAVTHLVAAQKHDASAWSRAITGLGIGGAGEMSRRSGARELDAGMLRRTYAADALGFASTEEVKPLDGTVGQTRANEAISFGLEAPMAGYNIFATGSVGAGQRTSLEAHLHRYVRGRPTAGDWVCLHSFSESRRPIAVALASGEGQRLAADMRAFLEDARREFKRPPRLNRARSRSRC
jgi:acyl carrier protein